MTDIPQTAMILSFIFSFISMIAFVIVENEFRKHEKLFIINNERIKILEEKVNKRK